MKKNLKKLISYYRPYMKEFLFDMFCAILSALITLVIPMIVRYITSNITTMETVEALSIIKKIIIALIVLIIVQFFCNYYVTNNGHVMGAKIEYTMREEIFSHYQDLSYSFYNNEKVGQLLSRVTSDLFEITELLHHGPENIVISLIKIVGSIIILSSISLKLTLVAFIMIPIMAVYSLFLNKQMKKAFRKSREKIGEINAQIEDNLSGIRVVKSFANEDIERDKFKQGNDGFLEAKKMQYRNMALHHSGLTSFPTLITVVIIAVGGFGIANKWLNVSDFITFLLYINVFTDPVRVLIDFTEQFQNGYSGFERFMEIMDVVPEITEKEDAKELTDVKGEIDFNDVSFHYSDTDECVLQNVDLHVAPGEYIAVVGASGVGKTTLCSLIPRFFDVTGGSITIDGTDIRDVTLKSLRDHIGVVQQDVYLFMGTVRDNIAYGKPGCTEEEIVEAAKNANAYDFIMSLPDGFDTDIGQRGVKLSGGQKQRLSIARVFLKNPPVLIFDEATSALDNESEKVVQDSLEKLAHNRTTFVIAHRLTTIENAERIIVLTENGISEEGTHDELMAMNGDYARMVNVHRQLNKTSID